MVDNFCSGIRSGVLWVVMIVRGRRRIFVLINVTKGKQPFFDTHTLATRPGLKIDIRLESGLYPLIIETSRRAWEAVNELATWELTIRACQWLITYHTRLLITTRKFWPVIVGWQKVECRTQRYGCWWFQEAVKLVSWVRGQYVSSVERMFSRPEWQVVQIYHTVDLCDVVVRCSGAVQL